MKALEKINLIENIATELQQRFTFDVIDSFFEEFKVNDVSLDGYNSKRTYARDRLKGINATELKKIADELNIDTHNLIRTPPKNWENTNSVKAFISHTAKHKSIAKRLRDVLRLYNIECFVAHEDIKPSEEWQEEIRKALNTMDFFISLHTAGFSKRIWCQQEVGYAVAHGVKIIPIKFEEDPEGFIGKYQALIRGKKNAEEISQDILNILKDSEQTKEIYNTKISTASSVYDEIPF